MVRDAVEEHEKRTTMKILDDKNRGKKVWQHIKTLKNGNKLKKKEIILYDKDKKIIDDDKIGDELKTFWSKIYRANENSITEKWNSDIRREYENDNTTQDGNQEIKYVKGLKIEKDISSMIMEA